LCPRSDHVEIEEHVKQIHGIESSPWFVSRPTEQLQQQITDWQSRLLERIYPVVFVDGWAIFWKQRKVGVHVQGRGFETGQFDP
jgi:transposase-like protein